MRASVLLPLTLLAVAHADVLIRSEVRSFASSGFPSTADAKVQCLPAYVAPQRSVWGPLSQKNRNAGVASAGA